MNRKVIIDCDPGIDDSLAIMMALNSNELDVIGITIVCGNSPVELGFENAKRILKHMNRLDVPVYMGANKPLKKEYVNALDTHGQDGLGESFLDQVVGYEQSMNAVEYLSSILSKESVNVIAIGPMTNLAHLIEYDERAFNNIDTLVSMGGNYKSHGNCSPVAEYNYWEDPEAASIVYKQMEKTNKKIHMIGLDVTRKIVLTPELLNYLEELNFEQGDFIRKITKFYFKFHLEWEHLVGCVINDPLAVAYFIDSSICSGFDSFVEIETESISRGQSLVDAYSFYRKPFNAKVLTEVDVKKFFYMFFERILKMDRKDLSKLEELV